MLHGENHHDFFDRKPSIQGSVPVPATRQDQLPSSILDKSTQVWVICQQLECTLYTEQLQSRAYRVPGGDEFEQAFQILQRPRLLRRAMHALWAA